MDVRVRNRTGVIQVLSQAGVTLKPGIWQDVSLPKVTVLGLHKRKTIDVDWDDLYASSQDDVLWQSEGTTHMLWMAPFSLADGYATASEGLIRALTNNRFDLYLLPCWFAVYNGLHPRVQKLLSRGVPEDLFLRVGLCMATPGEFSKLPTPYRIGLTMYESDNPLERHPEWKRNCGEVDALFVPSRYCKEIFSSFVNRPIRVVPLATNPMYNVGLKRKYTPKDTFTFFMHGTLTERKSPRETLDAFQKAFPRDQFPHVKMVFKTRLGIFGLGQHQLPKPDDDRISIYDHDWYASRLLDQFNEADAYLFPSKGEGYGMTPREAMFAGLPTIFSDNTALKDIVDDKYNWPIPMVKKEKTVLGGDWSLPDWDYMIDVMRWMVANPKAAHQKAQKATRWIMADQGQPAVASKWEDALASIDVMSQNRGKVLHSEVLSHGSIPRLLVEHGPFFKIVKETIPHGSSVWDIGVGSGFAIGVLSQLGYRVSGVIEKDLGAAMETIRKLYGTLPMWVMSLLEFTKYAAPIMSPAAFISQGVLQRYYDAEIAVIIRGVLLRYPGKPIVISVPSIHYPGAFAPGSRLMALDNWWHILRQFEISRACYYGPGRRHICLVITGLNANVRGTLTRNMGRIAENVWRPGEMGERVL